MKKIILFAFFPILLAICSFSCKKESIEKKLFVTDINKFITQNDINSGILASKSNLPSVSFSHETHDKNNIKCITCHHKKYNDERIKTCAFCHKGIQGAKLFHKLCMSCHKERSGPSSCGECHIIQKKEEYDDVAKLFENTYRFTADNHEKHKQNNIPCIECHHETIEGKNSNNSCGKCHSGHSKALVFHSFCKNCHKIVQGPIHCYQCHKGIESFYSKIKDVFLIEKTGNRFAKQISFSHKRHSEEYNIECTECHHNGSLQKCGACHKKKDIGSVMNLKSAFHQQCHECHNRTKGPKNCYGCHEMTLKK